MRARELMAALAVTMFVGCPMDVFYSRSIAVTVPPSVQTAVGTYPQELRYRAGGRVFRLGTLCGPAETDFVAHERIDSFGDPQDVTVTAWLTPAPSASECGPAAAPIAIDGALVPEPGAPSAVATVSTRGPGEYRLVIALP
jgi:hypothetical protein